MQSESPFQSVYDLGSLVSEHPVKWTHRWGNAAVGVALVGIGIGCLLFGAVNALPSLSGGSAEVLGTACILSLAGLGALALGGWCLFAAVKNWEQAVALFERGFAFAGSGGARSIPWEEVTAVWQSIVKHYTNGIYTGTSHRYTVQLSDDTRYILNDKFQAVETLGSAVQKSVTQALYPKYVAALKAGSRLEFGPLALDYNKLYAGKKELAWDEIKSIRVRGGAVSVKKDKGWFRWANSSVPQIPNFYIFYALLKNFTAVE
jgi:hypothetical protein